MISEVTNKLYTNELYLNYLRYNPKWYLVLDRFPDSFKEFEKEAKSALKITIQDKIGNLRKQIDFINGILKYLNNS